MQSLNMLRDSKHGVANLNNACLRADADKLPIKLTTRALNQVPFFHLPPESCNAVSCGINTVKALLSGHPRDAKKVSATGADRLREWFS